MEIEGISVLILSIVTAFYLLLVYKVGAIPSGIRLNTDIYITKPKIREGFFDFSKGLAIVAVIIIHTVFIMNAFSEDLSVFFLEWNECINRIMRFAIPVFFISSGALLFLTGLDKESLKGFYLPKIKRIFIPYVFFSFFATFIGPEDFTGLLDYIPTAFKDLLTGGALLPYWFMPVLFQLYLLYPLIWYTLVIKKVSPITILTGSFIFSLFSYFLFSPYWLNWQYYLGELVFFGSYLFFFVLGITLKSLFFTKNKEALQWLFKIKFFHFAFLILLLYFFIGAIDPLSHYYNIRLIYGPTFMMIIFYLYSFLQSKKISTIMEKIGKESLYIYLLHFIILLFLLPFIKFLVIHEIYPAIIFIFVFIVNFVITYASIYMVKKQ